MTIGNKIETNSVIVANDEFRVIDGTVYRVVEKFESANHRPNSLCEASPKAQHKPRQVANVQQLGILRHD
jgi:hypothetical protein